MTPNDDDDIIYNIIIGNEHQLLSVIISYIL